MKVMVVGGGGREHAIIKKLRENGEITELFALPGNGGIAELAICIPIGTKEIEKQAEFASTNQIDFAVVAPDDPLVLGAVDMLHKKGIPCFGPDKKAALIEGSKVFSKGLMKKYGIPTAAYEVFMEVQSAREYINQHETYPLVIKADGLALGKGVLICENREEALLALQQIMEEKAFGESGNSIVIEEYLTGPEITVLAFTDGKTIVPMPSSMDHKRALDGDEGLNTGGMGAISPNPFYTSEIAAECMERIFLPTINAMNLEGRQFKGCLYFGLMLTADGPKVIEYNCRFGDPEAQAVLPLLETDLFDIFRGIEEERLGELDIRFKKGSSCCVILASKGYPVKYTGGYPISFGGSAEMEDIEVYHSGTKLDNGRLVNSGGRVLGVIGTAATLEGAIAKAYKGAGEISFENVYYRKDIGKRALDK